MLQDVVTVFNRRDGLWYPTVLEGVHIQRRAAVEEDRLGTRRADEVLVLAPYTVEEGRITVGGKEYLPPRQWRRAAAPEGAVTFTCGEAFDILLLGRWEEDGPAEDSRWPEGFYGWLDRERDGVYALAAVKRFDALPHFELTGR